MPCGAGRNIRKLVEIARRTGIHVIAATGLHLPRYYPTDHWRFRLDATALAEIFATEIETGTDISECATPDVDPSLHRAGIIKAASAGAVLDDSDRPLFEAAALAHLRTGAPVMTHCEAGRGVEQIDFLRARGVPATRIVLSHTDRQPDPAYHRALLATGARLEYDRWFRGPLDRTNPTLRLAATLLPEFPDQIMFGTDAARPAYWRSYGGGPGLDFLLTTAAAWLREAGMSDELLQRAFVHNPAAAFSLSAAARQ
jgi:phosphotriesterase-related protein